MKDDKKIVEAAKALTATGLGAAAGYTTVAATGMTAAGMVGGGAGFGSAAGPVGAAVGAAAGATAYGAYKLGKYLFS